MKTQIVNLTSDYTYIRCDSEFDMLMTNGTAVKMWRGFYCFKTEQLQEYNTNGQMIIQTDDLADLWWLCSNTLIMSVTDINNQTLALIGQINSQNALANINALAYYERTESLLQSVQNTLSIFINTYVQANSVQDFGYIEGTIDNTLNVQVFIAKANKYSFNCGIVFSNNFQTSVSNQNPFTVTFNSKLFDIRFIDTTPNYDTYYHYGIKLKDNLLIGFSLYNNLNELQSGFSVSNVSLSELELSMTKGTFMFSSPPYSSYSYQTIPINFSNSDFNAICSINQGLNEFSFSMSEIYSSKWKRNYENLGSTFVPITVNEKLKINFDVAKS